jgi:lipopolysaccharide transport system ATP-binding protein
MSDIAIRVENLSKAYRIGLKEQRHETLAGAVVSFVKSPWQNYRNLRKLSNFGDTHTYHGPRTTDDGTQDSKSVVSSQLSVDSSETPPSDVIWALKDVSFEVKRGEVVGIIGRNGAGKSTLLKILSRITEPTSGRATIYGRVGSLLEVGTGFHPDLTGRENIYLNGTILGMSKKEVDRKFDEIVAFSEVEKFIDTPVKRYSSGMRVRLAFAVAAYLEPEILIVDEVLAVGDLNFQRKCLGKMGEIAEHGRTVLFVSHNMAAVVELCQRGLVLESGEVRFDGTAGQSVNYYVQKDSRNEESCRSTDGSVGFENLRVNQSIAPRVGASEPLVVSVLLKGAVEGNPWIYLIVEDASGRTLLHSRKSLSEIHGKGEARDCTLQVSIPPLFMSSGVYSIYFKALCTTVGAPSRIVSVRLPIEVRGESDSLGLALLSPGLAWRVTDGEADPL